MADFNGKEILRNNVMDQSMDANGIGDLIARILQFKEQHSQVLVAIDGRGGAGKSTLAITLVSQLPGASMIEFDWFHLPQKQVQNGLWYDFDRFKKQVVLPFRSGATDLGFHKYNWGYLGGNPDGLEPNLTCVPSPDVLVVEGCYVLSSKIQQLFDVKIWLDTPAGEALQRGIRRDIEDYGLDRKTVERRWQRWTEQENRNLAHDNRRKHADLLYR